ncbi:MAG: hypothetical protein U9Q72_00835 [Patescibacteria group bacterium]|nr:hypothetical protein [Patescibacteria group bacterium]
MTSKLLNSRTKLFQYQNKLVKFWFAKDKIQKFGKIVFPNNGNIIIESGATIDDSAPPLVTIFNLSDLRKRGGIRICAIGIEEVLGEEEL